MAVTEQRHGILQKNIARPVIDETVTGAGTITREMLITSGTLIVGLLVEAISGSVDVVVKTYEGDDSSSAVEILSWNNVTATTASWSIKKADLCLSRVIITVTYTNNTTLKVVLKSTDGGESTEPRDVDVITDISERANTLEAIRTTLGTTATRVSTPTDAEVMWIKHMDTTRVVWVGNSSAITAAGSDVFPLGAGEVYKVRLRTGDNNEVYAILEDGVSYIYVLGGYNA
jgi:hypothetical protein